jgi:very-short-patch-repair endonuclease
MGAWNSGLSKNTDDRIMSYSRSISNTMKDKSIGFTKGYTPWNKGITMDRKSPEYHARIMQLREALKNRKFDEKTRKKFSENGKKRHLLGKKMPEFHGPHTELSKEKMSLSRKGKKHSLEWSRKIGDAHRGKKLTDETIRKIIIGSRTSPNRSELMLFDIITNILPDEYTLNVYGDFIIDGKVPDFVNISGKKIIELFGEHWHLPSDENKRINCFLGLGWDTLIIWEKELKDQEIVEEKILKFNGDISWVPGTIHS